MFESGEVHLGGDGSVLRRGRHGARCSSGGSAVPSEGREPTRSRGTTLLGRRATALRPPHWVREAGSTAAGHSPLAFLRRLRG
ncbi:hypothetical protein STTU_5307 [Streptomyces sp. Tu6071]|nr:hypothetical protein STTU_5307 [Streptomyces sp. Tu6071]